MSDGALAPGRPDPAVIDPTFYLHERYRDPAGRRATLNLYYALKPLIPRRLQIALRRLYARRARPSFPDWPIEPLLVEHEHQLLTRALQERSLARLPVLNYWPDGHRFAVVVTHDVESAAGVEGIQALLELEQRHGIVSCWNFVAEWYPITAGTFERVRAAGGEVGLHGIKHDGRLFADRASFERDLPAIHRYLSDWGAVGFRSPALHRNVDWMAELGCLYDSSFPDTDPYEPEPGGCCSILPYFLGSLVELPVTMVQDHTLWEILREPDIGLWRRKADWIIANHGLINVIVHPDYVDSPQRLELYSQLLAYLREQLDAHNGWHALPREVASWWQARAGMAVAGDGEAASVVAGAGSDGWLPRARIAWASARDGGIAIDV
jgi:hypothetical protein